MLPTSAEIEQLAAAIGADVYIDVTGWHLYLREAKLHSLLAEAFAPLLAKGTCDEAAVTAVLQKQSVAIGGHKQHIPLLDLLPVASVMALMDILEAFAKQWRN